jgi:bifunctional DNA-binding transcriptional regulator/antitoxin component of YhaV-PrlF toxin-antitoxin module
VSEVIDVRIATNGRMVLPRAVREALGMTGAGVVLLTVDGDDVRLTSMRRSIERAQALYRQYVIDDQPSGAFLEDRRREAERDRTMDKT